MNPVDEFFMSVRGAFAPRDRFAIPPAWWVALGIGLLLGWAATRFVRKRQAERALQALARDRGVSADGLGLVVRVARRAHTSPGHVLTRMAVFESASAAALADEPPTRSPAPGSLAASLRQVRRQLGFDVLPPHHFLLTTRELLEGDEVHVSGATARVTGVNEASFTIRFDGDAPAINQRDPATMTLIRPDDARYKVRCRVIEKAGRELLLAHDEMPERVQLRERVRVRVHGEVEVTPIGAPASRAAAAHPGTLRDVSAGGLSVDVSAGIPRASLVLCTFTLAEGERFETVTARVLESEPSGRDSIHLRLAFTGLPDAERERMVRAVAWHERHGPDVRKSLEAGKG